MPFPALCYKLIPGWPNLAWVASMNLETAQIVVNHGPAVETTPYWCAEMVWNLSFEQGDFDRTDVVLGSGVRVRSNRVTFVSASDMLNRIQYMKYGDQLVVSNSISALLATVNADLLDNYDYADKLYDVCNGLDSAIIDIPTSLEPIRIVHFYNVVVCDGKVTENLKPDTAPDIVDYHSYLEFLNRCTESIAENANSPHRRYSVTSLATCSKGYDSPAVSLLAKKAGAREAAIISNARRESHNLFAIDDSGHKLADKLGLVPRRYKRHQRNYPYEDAIWAVLGSVGDVNLTIFDYPQPVCLLWTGFMGDKFWSKRKPDESILGRKADFSGIRFNEARLEFGVILCSPVMWAPYREKEIQDIYGHSDMRPWRLNTGYDRPIPRRMLEEFGIHRCEFGIRKKASTFNMLYASPLSQDLCPDFYAYMQNRGKPVVGRFMEMISLWLRAVDSIFLSRLPGKIRFSCRHWVTLPEKNDFLLWANQRRKVRFEKHIRVKTNLE